MNLISYLVGPIWVVELTLDANGHDSRLWRSGCNNQTEPAHPSQKKMSRGIVAVTVSGYGVVRKPVSTELATRIRTDPKTFLWSERQDDFFFVRRERLQPILKQLVGMGLVPQRILVNMSPLETARITRATIGWKSLVHPTNEGSALAQAIIRRIGLPILAFFFLLLAANVAIFPSLNAKKQMMQTQLAAQERVNSENAANNVRQRTLLSDFIEKKHPIPRSVVCDRIATAVPEDVILTLLEVEPLIGHFDVSKLLQRQEGAILIHGTAPNDKAISRFIEQLSTQHLLKNICLIAVERGYNSERLSFQIESHL